jgi:3-deoxy-D-manno-octulosonic-acid transferase
VSQCKQEPSGQPLQTRGAARPSFVTYLLYDIATSLAAPVGATYLYFSTKHRPLLARFAPSADAAGAAPVWIQACSVGEVAVAKPIITALAARRPDLPILLTASTSTGHAQAEALAGGQVQAAWFPFDHRVCVNRFVKRVAPRALVLLETELWPNALRIAARAGVPTVILNGRVSDKHYPRYLRHRRFFASVIRHVTAAGMQNGEYAERLASLGLEPARLHVTGCTKFDGVATSIDAQASRALRDENGLGTTGPVVLFGSTRSGDEALAADCWRVLREAFPESRLVVAPRHLERVEEAVAAFDEPVLRRSEVKAGRKPQGERVLVVDTMGELVSFYGCATLVVIGGSFFPGVNGHNPLESAALGVPTVFGPYMRNFSDPARVLVDGDGARQVARAEDLSGVLRGLLSESDERQRMGRLGREAVLANQGAISRSLDLLDAVLANSGLSTEI